MKKKYQTNFDIIPLQEHNTPTPQVIKVGILPFIRSAAGPGEFRILAMKPFAEKEVLGSPKFQIAKGTRRINISGRWCDMRADDLLYADESFHEPLVDTALREGHEEIGLRPGNIRTLFDMGSFTFISASKGTKKLMHLFAAEIADPANFGRFEATTSETRWFTLEEFDKSGREDHTAIVRDVLKRLKGAL